MRQLLTKIFQFKEIFKIGNFRFIFLYFLSQKIAHLKTRRFPQHYVFVLELKILSIWNCYFTYMNGKRIHLRIFSFLFDQNRGNNKADITENVELCL